MLAFYIAPSAQQKTITEPDSAQICSVPWVSVGWARLRPNSTDTNLESAVSRRRNQGLQTTNVNISSVQSIWSNTKCTSSKLQFGNQALQIPCLTFLEQHINVRFSSPTPPPPPSPHVHINLDSVKNGRINS